MERIGLEQWNLWRRQGLTRLPAVAVRTPADFDLADRAVRCRGGVSVLLESGRGGRYSFYCARPERTVFGSAEGAEIRGLDGVAVIERRKGAPLEIAAALLAERAAPGALPGWPAMIGGLIGLWGYDLVHTWERLPHRARRDLALPLYVLIEPVELLVYDHSAQTLGAIVWVDVSGDIVSDAALAELFARATEAAAVALTRAPVSGRPAEVSAAAAAWTRGGAGGAELATAFSPGEFQAAVRTILSYIAEGHTYQVNLSLRTSRATDVPATAIYEALRAINPSPYMGLLSLPEWALVCGSPELLVRLVDGAISSRPIAGTRPRGAEVGADATLSAELLASPKERAEHLMLVDLIRNDIGRVADYGSVHVPEFMGLERYSHVMHIVSQVEGRLAADKTWIDVFRSMFPGGTITGCPKVRTMEIIEEVEPVGRGFYTGALGWIGYGGAMELNIVIRSMLVKEGVAHVQAGAGIVADSIPERELDESLRKAKALWAALDRAAAASPPSPHG